MEMCPLFNLLVIVQGLDVLVVLVDDCRIGSSLLPLRTYVSAHWQQRRSHSDFGRRGKPSRITYAPAFRLRQRCRLSRAVGHAGLWVDGAAWAVVSLATRALGIMRVCCGVIGGVIALQHPQ